jgi:hypothetical protein
VLGAAEGPWESSRYGTEAKEQAFVSEVWAQDLARGKRSPLGHSSFLVFFLQIPIFYLIDRGLTQLCPESASWMFVP